MKQLCDKCKKIIILNAFTTSKCENCGDKITTRHIPGYIYCDKCADQLNKCKQCGKDL